MTRQLFVKGVSITANQITGRDRGLLRKKHKGRREESQIDKFQIFIQDFFKIVLLWRLDLICHNVGTPLKHNKYIFDIPIPVFVILYLSATFKTVNHHVM